MSQEHAGLVSIPFLLNFSIPITPCNEYIIFYAGYFCSGGSPEPAPVGQIYGDVCEAGHYCPNGTDISVPCPPGTFLPDTGLQAVEDCLHCTGGMTSSDAALQHQAEVQPISIILLW